MLAIQSLKRSLPRSLIRSASTLQATSSNPAPVSLSNVS